MTALSTLLLALQGTDGPGSGGGETASSGFNWLPILLILGIFYFILIRPEQKKQKERQALLGRLKKGDKVMTSSGIYGNVVAIQEDVVTLQVADGVRIRFNRAAVQDILTESAAPAKDGDKQEDKGAKAAAG